MIHDRKFMTLEGMTRAPGIYAIINYVRDIHYVGSAIDVRKRVRDHRAKLRRGAHENAKFQRAWAKYGEGEFFCEFIEPVADERDLLAAEQRWLDISAKRKTLNLLFIAGRSSGFKMSPESRMKMSIARRGIKMPPRSEEHRQNLSIALTGKKLPPQTESDRAKKSIALRGNKNALGCVRSPETRARMSAAQRKRFGKCE